MPREDGMGASLVSRDLFPMLQRLRDRMPVVYLDAAASTPSPHAVLTRERHARAELGGSAQHGGHLFADEACLAYQHARATVARFINADAGSLVFLGGTTQAIDFVAGGLGLRQDDVVVTTSSEHHANLVPWLRRASVRYLDGSALRPLDPMEAARELRRHRPRVFAFSHVSSISGVVQPAAELCAVARELGIVSVVDAAQSAPRLPLDVTELGCDFLAFSAHKLLGPKGIGALYGRPGALELLESRRVHEAFELALAPKSLEFGTPNVHGAAGFEAAVEFLDSIGRERIVAHGRELARILRERFEDLPLRHLLGATEGERIPIATLVLRPGGVTARQLASTLSQSFGVMVGCELPGTHPLLDEAGSGQNVLRAAAYLYNDAADIHRFADACENVLKRCGS
jgi:cysteine desulfurase/selenocysteine lyase